MPRLLLHIGTHKTGTTSIQRFCGANRDALRKRGVWYPPADIGSFPSHYAHHRIAHAIAGRDQEFGTSDATEFFERVRKQMKRNETCLISAEPMYRHMLPDPFADGGLAKLHVDEADMRFDRYASAVRECLDAFEVTVLVMLRRQDTFLESLYAEQVLATGYTRDITSFAIEREPLLNYEARLGSWAKAFGENRISVRVFDPSPSAAPIERDFVEWVGLEWSNRFRIGRRHNVTPSRTLVEFKRMINTPGQSVEINNRYRRWIEQLGTRLTDDLPDLGHRYLRPDDRVDLMARFAPANRAVAQRYCDGSALFRSDISNDPADHIDLPQLSEADFRSIATRMFRMIAEELNV